MSPGGRHNRKVRELKRRMDAVIEEERERRQLPPPPISAEHAAMRERIERGLAELERQLPDGNDLREALGEAIRENPELANDVVDLLELMQEEEKYLAGQGVDPRPYHRYEPKF
jgi:hypothetical protein